jgi:hypothetical protein
MASGGSFQIIINNAIDNEVLTASQRIRDQIQAHLIARNPNTPSTGSLLGDLKAANPLDLPSLNKLTEQNVLFCNYLFKPFISIGTQYIKKSQRAQFGQEVSFQLNQYGYFISDMVVHIRLSKFHALDSRDRVSYTSFPAHKLLKRVRFRQNHVDIDSYDTEDYNDYYEYEVPLQHKTGWERCVGQDTGYAAKLLADPRFDGHQEARQFYCGYQTPKQEQDTLDLWVPLLFWFRDIQQALPNYMVAWGKTEIVLDLCALNDLIVYADYGGGGKYTQPQVEMCELYTNNIFISPEIFYLFAQQRSIFIFRQHKALNETLTLGNGQVKLNRYLKNPVELMYVKFRPMSNRNLYHYWYKNSRLVPRYYNVPVLAKDPSSVITGQIVRAEAAVLANDSLVRGARVEIAGLPSQPGGYSNWNFVLTSGNAFDPNNCLNNNYVVAADSAGVLTLQGDWNSSELPAAGSQFELFRQVFAMQTSTFFEEIPTVSTIELKSYGVSVIEPMQQSFFNQYVPMLHQQMTTPSDHGSVLINFCHDPYKLQPSSYLNFSASQETYLVYTSDWISPQTRAELIVRARTLNFLYMDKSSGNIVILYP